MRRAAQQAYIESHKNSGHNMRLQQCVSADCSGAMLHAPHVARLMNTLPWMKRWDACTESICNTGCPVNKCKVTTATVTAAAEHSG